jgi:hypothetical protein
MENVYHAAPGSLGQRWIEGPRKIGLDLNLLKRVRLTENKTLEVRVDAVNALNHPQADSLRLPHPRNPRLTVLSSSIRKITY